MFPPAFEQLAKRDKARRIRVLQIIWRFFSCSFGNEEVSNSQEHNEVILLLL
jgi:hypothetical protein